MPRGTSRKSAIAMLRQLTDISLANHEEQPCAVFYPPVPHFSTLRKSNDIDMSVSLTVMFDPREINRGRGVDDLLKIRKLVRARCEMALHALLDAMDEGGE